MQLVTGASGFIGRHLVRYLSGKGYAVRAVYNSTLPGPELTSLPGVEWVRADLLDVYDVEAILQDITDVYHCAAIVSFNPAEKARILHFNKESTANIVNESLEQDIRKLVYVSSVAALGRSKTDKPINEDEEWEESKFNSVYAESKHEAELEVWRGMGEGLNAAIVNPGIILGEGDWDKGSAKLITLAYKEFPFYTQGINAWVDVSDVVRIMHLIMTSEIEAERFVVSAGNFAYRDIFTMMAKALNKKPPHIKTNNLMTGLIWRWNLLKHWVTGQEVTITRETAATAQRKTLYDNGKLLRFLPEFTYTPMRDTIQRMASAYLKTAPGRE